MKWYLKALRQFADFKGRARRKEYWMFVLFNIIFLIVAAVIDNILGTTFQVDNGYGGTSGGVGYVYILYAVAMLVPGLAVAVRRLHDVGKSGWMYFIALIPIIGSIWLVVLFCTEGQSGPNKWGDDPKSDGTEDLLQPQV